MNTIPSNSAPIATSPPKAQSAQGDSNAHQQLNQQPLAALGEDATLGLTAEGKALMQALQEIDQQHSESQSRANGAAEEGQVTDKKFSMKKALMAAATVGGVLLAVA